jgi:hypothetical protein
MIKNEIKTLRDPNPCTKNNLTQQLPARVLITDPLSYFIIYNHIEILHKKTIKKMRLYTFIWVISLLIVIFPSILGSFTC